MPRWRALVVVVVALAASGCGADAEPTGRFRGNSDPFPAKWHWCNPFPKGADRPDRLLLRDDTFVVASDGEVRRHVLLQYVDGDARSALDEVVAAFEGAGFAERSAGTDRAELDRADYGSARVTTRDLGDVDAASTVRGTIELDLPGTSRRPAQEAASGCRPPRHRALYRQATS